MALSINSNAALFSARFLNSSQNSLQTAQERLSSGKRINRASDDAAGLAIAAQLANQLLGSQQAYRNTNDAISLSQTAESSISELQNISQRVRELAMQSANGSLGDTERAFLQQEVSALQEEASNIISNSEFNNTGLLNQNGSIDIQIGGNEGRSVSVSTTDLAAQLTADGFFSVDISTANDAQTALGAIDASVDTLVRQRSEFGAFTNRLEAVGRNLQAEAESLAATRSRIEDADYAMEITSRTTALMLQNAGIASIAQGNINSQMALQLLK